MIRHLPLLPLLCAALAAAQPAGAASSATVSTGASLQLNEPISIGVAQNLVIGAVNLIPTTSTASISPTPSVSLARAVSPAGAVVPAISPQFGNATQRLVADVSRGTVQQASFVIVGDTDRSVSISIPDTVSLSRLGGEEQLEFDSQTSLASGDPGQSRLAVGPDGSGQLAFDVGGRVQLADNTVAGDYAGILRVTVQYN